MGWGPLIFLAMFLAFVIWAALYVRPQGGFGYVQEFPGVRFQPEPLLANPSECAAWEFLQRADLGQAHVFAKVRMEDVVSTRGPQVRRFIAHRSIKARSIDFVLTDSAFRPLVAVDIDGRPRRAGVAAAPDEFEDRMLSLAGVPLLRLPVGADWNQMLKEWRQSEKT